MWKTLLAPIKCKSFIHTSTKTSFEGIDKETHHHLHHIIFIIRRQKIWKCKLPRTMTFYLHCIILLNSPVEETKVKLKLPSCLLRWVFRLFSRGKGLSRRWKCLISFRTHNEIKSFMEFMGGCAWLLLQINVAFLLEMTIGLLQACVIKRRWVSPHLTHRDALSASAQLEAPCFVLWTMTDMLLLCSEYLRERHAPVATITIMCGAKLARRKTSLLCCSYCGGTFPFLDVL